MENGEGKKEKEAKTKKGLWKLTPLMEIRKDADSHSGLKRASQTRLFHSSHRPDGGINSD